MAYNQRYSIDLLKKMLEIYSPSGKEKKLASFLLSEFKKIDFKRAWMDKAGNVYGEIGSESPTILLCGHMDTVPGWIAVKIEGEKLFGRGAVDAKSSLAAMIAATLNLKPEISKGRIIVACVVDEEGKGRGIRQLIRENISADYAIFGEPSGIRNITFAYKGHLKLKITCRTVTGHVGAQHILPNAIEKSFELWSRLKNVCEQKYKSPFGIFYSLTPTLIGISSRRTTGSIPDICTLSIDLRLPPTISCQKAIKITSNLVEEFREENYGLTTNLKVTGKVEPYIAKRDTIVIRALKEAIFEETGEEARLLRKTGTGDMNIFGAHFKIPIATYGPGNSSLSHTPNEYINIKEYLTSIKIYEKAVKKILELS